MKKIIAVACLAVLAGAGVLMTTSNQAGSIDLAKTNIEATSVSAQAGAVCDTVFPLNCTTPESPLGGFWKW